MQCIISIKCARKIFYVGVGVGGFKEHYKNDRCKNLAQSKGFTKWSEYC